MALNKEILDTLRFRANQGASVPDLVRSLVKLLPPEPSYLFPLIIYLRAAFQLTLRCLTVLGGWSEDNTGSITDQMLNEHVLPEIERNRHLWHRPQADGGL